MQSLTIFDLDGVIIDSEAIAAETLAQRLSFSGYPVSEAIVVERFIGMGIPGILTAISAETGLTWPAHFQQQLENDVEQSVYDRISPMPGIDELLERLPQNAWCIASNSKEQRIRKCLEISGLANRFDPAVFSATMVKRAKPQPDLLLLAAEVFHIPLSRCLVVEDTVVGVKAGKSAGMKVMGFLGGSHISRNIHAAALLSAGADMLAYDVRELHDHLLAEGYFGMPA